MAGKKKGKGGRHGCESDLRRNRRESTTKTREGRVGACRSIDLALIPLCQDPVVSDIKRIKKKRIWG